MIDFQYDSTRFFAQPDRPKSAFSVRLSVLSVAILVSSLAFAGNAAVAAKTTQSVYVLKQNSKVFGDQTVYVSPTSLRLDMQRVNCTVVTQLPGQKFQIYSPSKKLYYETDIRKWHSNFAAPDKFEKKCREAGINWREVGSRNICGTKCGEYILGRVIGSKDKTLPKDPSRRRYFLADSIPISHEATELFARLCKFTPINKMPMRVRVWDKKKDQFYDQLNTSSCDKKSVPSSFFSVPRGYKKTANEFDVFVAFGDSSDPMTGIENILFRSDQGKGQPED